MVEEEIYQVRNERNQDPLNYPIRLHNKIGALLGAVEVQPRDLAPIGKKPIAAE